VSGDDGPIRILGIDPGSRLTGWGLVRLERGGVVTPVDQGVFRLPDARPLAERLARLHEDMRGLLASLTPSEVAVEDLYVARNVRSALTLGHARGVILLACAQAGLSVHEYPANTIKQAVLGQAGSAATKERVGFMVRAILGLKEIPGPADVTDALACAICHAHRRISPS
jgi:crossover junction endodeoxyribonuclease RuvC